MKTTSKKKETVKKTSTKQSVTIPKKIFPEDKQKLIEQFAQKQGDTGSPEVQTALLTQKILRLTDHLTHNKKDNHSRRGLLKVIAKRRRILNYLQKLDEKRYKTLIESLGLKK
ncbi:30S ribosomal protein S15 [Candidatus Roizmanbacteria bacterium CG_4_10_14_0_8_um_filter_33_9]|uniref:Small ribosomal subunit protein uS15 n=1 Tax=Candidatus Roizmanbacteria bacterium CG_4_10_14_0_8_um_filter_33_9 TaxID=1974826 RepID=A0A2M7QJF5_9BACT|nr:MAG: 30S ribosomal protein S15 [Candidatus Roizmanbacteria bacterium CG_4_10_14_0_8_um_filter_33_9]